jgi:hypothetical protein
MLPGSPGRENGGWTGFRVIFPLPQLPTQNEETSANYQYTSNT